MEAQKTQTEAVVDHFENVDGCSVADVSEGRVELTVTCMENCPNALPGGRKSVDVLVDVWGYSYTVEYTDENTCVVGC